jgi:predicted short-subunit dehydrogenase-like oxidoreductase (DUF2520 family)
MKIGLIGAGRMGFTLGRHLSDFAKSHAEMLCVEGFYSRNPESAREAARFTGTKYYEDMETLVQACDTIFLTVPDGQIANVAEEIAASSVCLDGKTMIHTSGALSSRIFSGMGSRVSGYSIHPIYAVNSKTDSYIHFQDCYMTIEGEGTKTQELICLFEKMGHTIRQISADQKAKYHASAVFASNLVIGLYKMGTTLLSECGFTPEEAEHALMPLFANNAENMERFGCEKALTGPVSRGDVTTVEKHLQALDGDAREVYRLLSKQLCNADSQAIQTILDMKE